MKLVDDGSFQQTPQVDDFILSELHQKFGLNTGWDDQPDAIWEKDVEEEDRVDADISQAEKKTKNKMNAPLSKASPAPHRPSPTLVAPKATGAMAHVSKMVAPKKQQPFLDWVLSSFMDC